MAQLYKPLVGEVQILLARIQTKSFWQGFFLPAILSARIQSLSACWIRKSSTAFHRHPYFFLTRGDSPTWSWLARLPCPAAGTLGGCIGCHQRCGQSPSAGTSTLCHVGHSGSWWTSCLWSWTGLLSSPLSPVFPYQALHRTPGKPGTHWPCSAATFFGGTWPWISRHWW